MKKQRLTLGMLMACLLVGNIGYTADFVTNDALINVNGTAEVNNDLHYNIDTSIAQDVYKNAVLVQNEGNLTINSQNISIKHTLLNSSDDTGWRRCAVNAMTGGQIVLGNADTENIEIVTETDKDIAVGLHAWRNTGDNGGSITVNSDKLYVNATSTEYFAYGIYVFNSTTPDSNPNGEKAKVVINSADTVIEAKGVEEGCANGIIAWSQGEVQINKGNVSITADNVINTRGNSSVEINADNNEDYKVQLNGDIVFEYNGTSSGTGVDSDVTIKLANSESYLNGNIMITGENIPEDKDVVTGVSLSLSNEAQWNTDAASLVNDLTLDNGIINVNGGEAQTVTVDNLQGNGTVNLKTDASDFSSGSLEVVKGDGALAVNFTGITADDITDNKQVQELAGNVKVAASNDKLRTTARIAEGLVSGEIVGVMDNDEDGNTLALSNIQQNKSTGTMDAMRDIASTAIIAWRQEDSTLSQRLGELRQSEGDQGVWLRISRGEFEYSGAYKNQYNYVQMGYDKAYGDWHYGAALSHNDGKTAYSNGSGDNRSTSLSLYGTWLGDKGHYADVVLKQGRLNNEFDIYTSAGHTHGDYGTWGTSLSGEYGMKMDLADGWFVTPQAQMTFMRIGGEDYTTSNGIEVSQDNLYSTVGRVGFELGKTISDKGSVYAKASLLHEFAGTADTAVRLGDKYNSYSQDIGNTWYEAGLGFNYKTTADSYLYADVVKTFGDDIKTPWQWNIGMRWSF